MAIKLYPPVIAGTLPAFSGTTLVVPYAMNRAVGSGDFNGLIIKVKTVSGILVKEYITNLFSKNKAIFTVDKDLFKVGQYYKVQMAYMSNRDNPNSVGYYSSIGVVKYTSEPEVFIEGLSANTINSHIYGYVGVYRQSDDTSEKIYSSRFYLHNGMGQLVIDSGEIIHNTSMDTSRNEAREEFLIANDLGFNLSHFLTFEITTNNGLKMTSPRYRIVQRQEIPSTLNAHLEAKLNYEIGAVELNLIGDAVYEKVSADFIYNPNTYYYVEDAEYYLDENDAPTAGRIYYKRIENQVASGSFLISRAGDNNNYTWEKIQLFNLQSEIPTRHLFTDFTVEQGVNYKYSIQQYNEQNIYSKRIISNDIKVDFEDLFLYDGKRQLKIKFNPKVSTYKTDVIENKMDTIGSKYPFIVRNGHVKYKEFNISGLISYQMDDMETFYSLEELGFAPSELAGAKRGQKNSEKVFDYEFPSTGLTAQNFKAERIFKNMVNDWLIDGKPKIYRSPSEGNYVVRLMNVNLSPIDTVSRMLHSFSCTAYEIADFNYDTLDAYNFIELEQKIQYQTRWATVEIANYNNGGISQINISPGTQRPVPLYSISLSELTPGTEIFIGNNMSDAQSFYIGATGAYYAEFSNPVNYVAINTNPRIESGLLTFSYLAGSISSFDKVSKVEIFDVPDRQFIGYEELDKNVNMLEYLQDVKNKITEINFINFSVRDIVPVYIDNAETIKPGMRYYNYDGYNTDGEFGALKDYYWYCSPYANNHDVYNNIQQEPWNIYKIYKRPGFNNLQDYEGYYIDKNLDTLATYTGLIYDPVEDIVREDDGKLFEIVVNGNPINIEQAGQYHLTGINPYESVCINPGIIADICYQNQITTYTCEEEDSGVKASKQNYEDKVKIYKDYTQKDGKDSEKILEVLYLYDAKKAYLSFIDLIELALEEKEG